MANQSLILYKAFLHDILVSKVKGRDNRKHMDNVSILPTLLRFMNESHSNRTQFSIAEGMLKNFKDIPTLSIYDMAEQCYVSPASISRFIKQLGFDTYGDFKRACKDSIDIDVDYSTHVLKAQQADIEPLFQMYTENVKENLSYNLLNIDFEKLSRISDMIYKADKVVYLGLEFATLLGQHYQQKMAECNRYIHLPLSYEKQQEFAKESTSNSLAIVVSLEAGYFYHNQKVINQLKENGTKIIAITMSHNSKMLRDIDEVIICNKNNSDTEGRISLLHTLELLIMYYYINYK
ncbi:TPA: MurR/RpiR family transcriptional regulator [Streptococcus suis]